MLLNEFKEILLSADPKLTKRFGTGEGNYTIWTPGSITREMSDDSDEDLIQRIYVERYTKLDNDPIITSIWQKLAEYHIPFEYDQDTEVDTKYIHHTFTCYVQVEL